MFSCVVGRERHCKQISLVCVGSVRSVWTTLGLPQLTVACASRVYTAQALGCSAGALSKVGSAFHALPRSKLLRFSGTLKGTDSVGCAFCALPRSEQLRQPGAWLAHCPRWAVHLNFLLVPSRWVSRVCRESTISSVLCVSSGELISGFDPPGRCQPSRVPGRHG